MNPQSMNGESVWNVENKICGATDIKLTQKGHEQAEETGRIILTMGIMVGGRACYTPYRMRKSSAK